VTNVVATQDTLPERTLRAALARLRAGPVVANDAGLPGSPDAALPHERVALFAHGCFWHHHAGCRHARIPPTAYPWAAKFARTRARDIESREALLRAGWRVGWVWECALTLQDAPPAHELDASLRDFLDGATPFAEIAGPIESATPAAA
jgi:DNA mismatch endonuclease (patch repair protein)